MSDYEDKIKAYLDKRAAEDELFAKFYAKENKTLEECCLYVLGEALKKSVAFKNGKAAVMDDDTVYGLAVHYYDEDDIKVEPLDSVRAEATTTQYNPTEEDRENAKKLAMERLVEEERTKMATPRKKKQHDESTQSNQMSLFA